mmetsp:Transcript_105820/g.298106  ORF Transcript_105820/g.298106 Transcript_105820/m.298106 type:complete len:100 (-) Transcript_105820:32-331(-)
MEAEAPPRFEVTTTEQWLAYLEEHGYCVLAAVADDDAVEKAKALMWDFMEGIPRRVSIAAMPPLGVPQAVGVHSPATALSTASISLIPNSAGTHGLYPE